MGNCQCFEGEDERDFTYKNEIKANHHTEIDNNKSNVNNNNENNIVLNDDLINNQIKVRTEDEVQIEEKHEEEGIQVDEKYEEEIFEIERIKPVEDEESEGEVVDFGVTHNKETNKTKTEAFTIKTFFNAKTQKEKEEEAAVRSNPTLHLTAGEAVNNEEENANFEKLDSNIQQQLDNEFQKIEKVEESKPQNQEVEHRDAIDIDDVVVENNEEKQENPTVNHQEQENQNKEENAAEVREEVQVEVKEENENYGTVLEQNEEISKECI